MPRKGRKRPIAVWGCDLEDGTRINAGEDGIVSVIVHGDHSVTITTVDNEEKLVEGAYWVGYVPRQN